VSMRTSAADVRSRTPSRPVSLGRSSSTLRLPRAQNGNAGSRRSGLPPGGSTQITPSPWSAKSWRICAPTHLGDSTTAVRPASSLSGTGSVRARRPWHVREQFLERADGDAPPRLGVDVVEELVQRLLRVPERALEVRVVAAPTDVAPAHGPVGGNGGTV